MVIQPTRQPLGMAIELKTLLLVFNAAEVKEAENGMSAPLDLCQSNQC